MALGSRSEKVSIEQDTDFNTKYKDGIKETSNVVTEPDKSAVMDTFHIPSSHLLKYGEGSPWPVIYYRRLLGENDSMEPLDVGTGNPSQQYEKIEGLILHVTTPLEPSQDPDTKAFTVTGRATISNSIQPNKHDVFTVEIGTGIFGTLTITESERKAYNKIATYEVSYTVMYELTPEIQIVLDTKTVREFVYEPDRVDLLESPMMTKDSHRRFVSVLESIKYIQSTYPLDFYKKTLQSLRLPATKYSIYDAFLTDFARNIGCGNSTSSYSIFPHPPYDADDFRTVWWALEHQQTRSIKTKEMVMFTARSFCGMRRPGSIGWTLFDRTYFPKGVDPLNVSFGNPGSGVDAPMAIIKSEGFEPKVASTPYSDLPDNLPLALPLDDKLYVFSEKFYDGSYASVLEYMMMMYLTRKQFDPEMILDVTDYVDTLPPLERYYYLPVCLLLLLYSK